MKWFVLPVAFGAIFGLPVFADLAGPAEIPVQAAPQKEQIGPIAIQVNETVTVRIPENIAGVSLGNSHIANIAVHDKNLLFLTGRAYGTTSLHIVDELGKIVVDTSVHVINASETELILTRGGRDYTLDCTPRCRAAPSIGDDPEYFTATTEQAAVIARDE